ncbi:siderophore ABC transporter substrate-binding protein [Achromobacter sp. AONIH1]|uniref:siderophore ABC transporter substrate-binding protein n=1 Tax=Achromobacter sp. AONIH1 TaxID=1758194 RepID=UPI000CD0FB8E|nr:siderophore ABC transporter substrate-binding protein [Achromobacter sp. AONIH1]AUT44756.1 ferric anguibactin-binding protein [Achromobacter sp. AONIH1]
MSVYWKIKRRAAASAMVVAAILAGCGDDPAEAPQAAQALAAPVTVKHQLGTTTVANVPRKVAVLDMNEADFLDQLGVPIAGMTKDYVPHFLSKYKDAPYVQDLGAIVQPNLERVHALKPDLILITPIQANHYQELAEIAPTLHFDVDYKNSQRTHIATVKQHLLTLGRIFDKEALAREKAAELDAKVEEARRVTAGRPEKAMIVMHNNGAFSAFGVQSRYAFVFDALGVRPASTAVETSLHGQPISSEFIQEANPDILYVVDRSAVMERRPVMDAERMANPLLRQTNAWKNGRVVFVDADAWYITAASVTSLTLLIDDVIKGYRR